MKAPYQAMTTFFLAAAIIFCASSTHSLGQAPDSKGSPQAAAATLAPTPFATWSTDDASTPSRAKLNAFRGAFISGAGAFKVDAMNASGIFLIQDGSGTHAHKDDFTFVVVWPSPSGDYYVYTGVNSNYEFMFLDTPVGQVSTVAYRVKNTSPWFVYSQMRRYEAP